MRSVVVIATLKVRKEVLDAIFFVVDELSSMKGRCDQLTAELSDTRLKHVDTESSQTLLKVSINFHFTF